ncbi:hypothetical protein VCRA2119O147_760017 [Vibrio crassostreae]|nr:hypothetical protein VCHA50O407_290041 [Vibrio chagasii]CAK1955645.1 hypothetical protein VCRA2113O351_280037 [Vibrio crassostreae]CAH7225318.1 hypothetical protein VCHA43P273_330020 [Vibrio chagasii]CAK1968454.1 hypothetical protein VCRA2118O41_290038 [Vibrio crassostreae]CAK1968507.1 hypothetical protein VCRA2113O324_290037 [Vibrio crassostreae]
MLTAEGIKIGRYTVRQIMREAGSKRTYLVNTSWSGLY